MKLSERQARAQKKQLRRELATTLRSQDRESLRKLRTAIALAKTHKRGALRVVVQQCRAAREAHQARAKLLRAEARAAINAAITEERDAARAACAAEKSSAKDASATAIGSARRLLDAERAYQAEIRRADQKVKLAQKKRRSSAEARGESDDEVRANVPSELVSVFDAKRKGIKGSTRKSRTEAFLQWAEENPGEVYAVQQGEADRALAKLIKDEREHGRAMRSRVRYTREPEALARSMAEVPF
jgi:hypothetical protein